jgi:hypothetical protein
MPALTIAVEAEPSLSPTTEGIVQLLGVVVVVVVVVVVAVEQPVGAVRADTVEQLILVAPRPPKRLV